VEVGHGADILRIVVGDLSAALQGGDLPAEAALARLTVVGAGGDGGIRRLAEGHESARTERGRTEEGPSVGVHDHYLFGVFWGSALSAVPQPSA